MLSAYQEFSGGITVRVTGTVGAGFSSDLAIDDVTFRYFAAV